MNLYEAIKNKQEQISVIGLGYVGMPLAVAFAEKVKVIGYDINKKKIEDYIKGIDLTKEVGNEVLRMSSVKFTYDESKLKDCKFHIVAVPTPVNSNKIPDLAPVIGASKIVGRNLIKGSIVVYESTVYPGVTEDICIPILERESGLICGLDFKVGYSPERINPGDKVHRLESIVKVVSGLDDESLDIIANTYELIIEAGVHRAESIKVAEAAKVIENSQRDINIAFMNELSMVFNKMGIDTKSVLEAASTKWNFLNFTPGLVGGHCIGVDPYYFIYKAEELGYHSQIILSGRKINDDMGRYVAENIIKTMIKADKQIKGSKVAIFGLAFKENCPDVRNTKVTEIIEELNDYGVEVVVVDPLVNSKEVLEKYGIKLCSLEELRDLDALIFAVPHDCFKEIPLENIRKFYRNEASKMDVSEVAASTLLDETSLDKFSSERAVLIDIKGMFNKNEAEELGYLYWRL